MAFSYESNWLKDQRFLKGLSEWHLAMSQIGSKIKAFQRAFLNGI